MSFKDRLLVAPPNPSRYHLERWAARAAAQGSGQGFRVLDAGAGDAPYRHLFQHVRYETADFGEVDKEYAHLDYVCDLAAMPMPDATYDLVFCSQVLEHIPEPLTVLREIYRVLKPGGQAWLSAPLFYEEHEQPYDFNRYTQFAWRRMAAESGFEVRSVERLEGYFGTVSYQAYMAARALPKRFAPSRAYLLLLSHRLARLDRKEKIVDRGMCKNYCVELVKPTHAE